MEVVAKKRPTTADNNVMRFMRDPLVFDGLSSTTKENGRRVRERTSQLNLRCKKYEPSNNAAKEILRVESQAADPNSKL